MPRDPAIRPTDRAAADDLAAHRPDRDLTPPTAILSPEMLEERLAGRVPALAAAFRAGTSIPALVAALALLAAMLRLYRLGDRSLWVDEITTAQTAALSGIGQVLLATPINRMPLDLLLSWAFHFLGGSELALRIPSAIYGTLLVPVIFLLGRRLLGARGGLIASLLVAVSPFAIWYSQEASPYALLMLLSCVQMWLAHRAAEHARFGDWLLLALVTALNLYTHYTAALVTVAAFSWIAAELCLQARDPRLRWEPLITRLLGAGTAGMLAALALAPWAPAIRGYLTFQAGADAGKYAGGAGLDLIPQLYNLLGGLSLGLITGFLAMLGVRLAVARRAMLLCFWIGVPLLSLAATLGPGLFNVLPRYLSAEWPAAMLLVAAGAEVLLAQVPATIRTPALPTAIGLAALLTLFSVPGIARWYAEPKDDWRGAAAAVSAEPAAGGVVLAMGLGSDFAATSIAYYLHRDGSGITVLDAGGSSDSRALDDAMAATIRSLPGPAWGVFAGVRGPNDLRVDGRSETGVFTTPAALPSGFKETDLTGVTVVRASSPAALLDWGAGFIPSVRAAAALVGERQLGAALLPPVGEATMVHLESSGPPSDRTWSAQASPGTPLVARFQCSSAGAGDARVYVSAHDSVGAWLALYPGNAGYRCQGREGAFAFALPARTTEVKLWLRVTGRGGGDFSDVRLSPVPRS